MHMRGACKVSNRGFNNLDIRYKIILTNTVIIKY